MTASWGGLCEASEGRRHNIGSRLTTRLVVISAAILRSSFVDTFNCGALVTGMAWTMTTLPLLAVAICTAVLVSSEGALKVRNGRTLCVYEKKTYRPGQRFKPNACTSCRCPKHGGRVRCSIKDCRYEPNCLQFDTSPKCCPACLRYGCLHSDGKVSILSIPHTRRLYLRYSRCEKVHCSKDISR